MTTSARDNLSADYKYAELPDGKLLRFSKNASEKEMQRAVRRELGLAQEDFTEAMSEFAGKISDLVEAMRAPQKQHAEAVEQMADALAASVGRLSGEMADTVRDLKTALQKQSDATAKIMSNQGNLIGKLNVVAESLNKTLDAALGQSLAAMDEGHASTALNAQKMERSINTLGGLVTRLAQAVEEIAARRKLTKRAYRERDGSWTMQVLG
jgi:hypothetical protein